MTIARFMSVLPSKWYECFSVPGTQSGFEERKASVLADDRAVCLRKHWLLRLTGLNRDEIARLLNSICSHVGEVPAAFGCHDHNPKLGSDRDNWGCKVWIRPLHHQHRMPSQYQPAQ
jgi:hypothetical protein